MRVAVGFLLALVMGSCPLLMPLAAAAPTASKTGMHSCCAGNKDFPKPAHHGQHSQDDCCLRAPLPSSISFSPAPLQFVALVPAARLGFAPERCAREFTSLSPPPGGPARTASSSRAPPVAA